VVEPVEQRVSLVVAEGEVARVGREGDALHVVERRL